MVDDLISRSALLAEIEHDIENSGCVNHERDMLDSIRYAPAIQPDVRRARWIRCANGVNDPECSECGWSIPDDTDEGLKVRSAYCGHCGARMNMEV